MRKGLTKGTIEAGIMGNDGIFGLDERPHRRHVDHLAVDHGVCDTGQSSDVGRDRNARLLQPAIDAGDTPISSFLESRPVVSVSRMMPRSG